MSGFLKYICLFNKEERYSPFWSVENFHFKRDGKFTTEMCTLHNSESSLSNIGSMETLLDVASDDRFRIAEDNPEVMFDVLTMQSLRDKYTEKDIFEVQLTAPYVNEQEFDNYVREFAIDDTISECFATSEESGPIFSLPFQKQNSSPLKQNRLKKKLNQKSPAEELILSDEESRSSDSKRSKLIGNIFNRNRKGKENIKPTKEVDTKDNNDITGQIIDACEHITKTYKQVSKQETQNTEKSPKRDSNKNVISPNGSINSEPCHASRRTSLGTRSRDSSSSRRLPPVPTDSSRSESSVTRRKHSTSSSTGVSRRTPKRTEGLIDELMSKSDNDLASALHTISYDSIRKTRDKYGNTVLHRCVDEDKPTSTKILSTKYPQMCSELNNDRLSPLEYSVKLGKCECMLILLEKSRSDGVLESLTVPRLLNMAALYDQPMCLESLLNLLPKSEGSSLDLPPDSMGNTAAHEAASKGHLRCLKILLDNGYDVWSKNSDNLCPIQLAIHNHHEECYGFMLLFESSRCLAREASGFYNKSVRLKHTKMANYDAFLQIESQLSRYQDQLNDAIRSTLESQENILVTLDCIYDQLAAVLRRLEGNTEISSYLENIKGEAEHLQDLFDFSMIANANSLLSRLLTEFREILKDADGKETKDGAVDQKPFTGFRSAYKEMLDKLVGNSGETFQQDIQQQILSFIESHKLPEAHFSDRESMTNSSSTNSNRTFTITKKSIKLHGLSAKTSKEESNAPSPQFQKDSKDETPTKHRKDSKVKSSLKRKSSSKMEKLVVDKVTVNKGDSHQTTNLEDNVFVDTDCSNMAAEVVSSHNVFLLESPSESMYTSTLTSESTAVDKYSDWTSRSDTLKRESCESGSEWWHENHGYYDDEEDGIDGDDDDDGRVRLNVDNEDLPDDMLRQHRLTQHLKSVEKITSQHNDVIETVVTASGRQLGRQNPSKIPKAAPRPSLVKEPVKQKETKRVSNLFSRIRNKNKVKLFNPADVPPSREITESEFRESYDRSCDADKNDLKWDEVSLTDGEEFKSSEKPWYEMSEDEESLLQGWNTDDDDKQSRDLGHL